MRYILLAFLLLLFGQGLVAQTNVNGKYVAPTWREHISLRTSAQAFQPFILETNPPDYGSEVKNASFLRLNPMELQRLLTERPRDLRIQIPTVSGQPMTVELFESYPISETGAVWTDGVDGIKKADYTHGLHYWGIVAGKVNSSVAFSFFNNQVMGLMMTKDGNYNLGALTNEKIGDPTALYVLYNDRDAIHKPTFTCGDMGLPAKKSLDVNDQAMASTTCKQVVVYFEADRKMFTDFGSSVANVTTYITGFFNQVAILYTNESINVTLGDIKVWTTADPYAGLASTSSAYLDEFRNNQLPSNPFTWDLAHLVSTRTPNLGGLGALDILCSNPRTRRAAFSNVHPTFSNVPTFSFTVEVVTHEMGHNLGSPHTHWCGWPGGAIDGCAAVEGSCTRPPNANPGTIMSYCDGVTSVDFNLGFGPLPGNMIRNRVANATCLTTFTVTATITAPAANPFQLCTGNNTTLTATPCTGCTYQWFKDGTAVVGGTNNTLNITTAGNYVIAVRKNACQAFSDIKSVVLRDLPCTPTNGTITNNRPDFSCGAPTQGGTLTLTGNTGTIISWQASTDNFVTNTPIPITTNTFDYPPLPQTTCFRVQLIALNPFSAAKCITVLNPPVITTFADVPNTCPDSTVLLQARCANCVSYSWSPATGLSNANVSNPTLTAVSTTTYTVTGTDNFGCTNTATLTISLGASARNAQRLTPTLCEGDQAVYRLNGPITGSITWQKQTNCTGAWATATGTGINTADFTSSAVLAGLTCYRAQVVGGGCVFNSNVDTIRACGTIRFTCTNTTYAQNFNTWRPTTPTADQCFLGNAVGWVDDQTIPGWFVAVLTGDPAINFNTRSSACGAFGFYNNGLNNDPDRSIGLFTSTDPTKVLGAVGLKMQNNTGGTITSLQVRYRGKQWFRFTTANILDRLDFQYSTNATAVNNGTWTDFNALDLITPQRTIVGPVNGNLPASQVNLNQTITGLSIPSGQTFWIRWTDFDQTALPDQDDLSVDDLNLTVTFTGTIQPPTAVTPPAQHCPNTTQTYTVAPVSGSPPITYTWAIPGGCAGWALASPNNTGSTNMQITAGTGNCSGITVTATDGCGQTSTPFSFNGVVANCTNLAGAVGQSQTICSGSTPAALNLTGHTGTVINWELSVNCPAFTSPTPLPVTTTSLNLPALNTTTCFRAIVNTGNGNQPSDIATITVAQPPVGGTVSPASITICPNACTTLTLSGHTGSSIQWQQQFNCTGAFNNMTNETATTLSACTGQMDVCFRAMVSSPPCTGSAISTVSRVSADLSVLGTIVPAQNPICPGGCANLTLTNFTGTGIQWQRDDGCTGVFINVIGGTTANMNDCNVTTTACFRALFTHPTCGNVISFVSTITVDPTLVPTVTVSPNTSVCAGLCTSLTASGANTYLWTPGGLTGATVNVCPMTTTVYTVTGTVTGGCSNTATVTVTANACNSVGGDVTPSQTICNNTAAGVLTLQNHAGSVIRWESSTDNFATNTTIANTTVTHNPGVISQNICFRAVVQFNPNPPAFSTPACITVVPPTVAGTAGINQTICNGSSATITLTGQTGNILRWETSTDPSFTTLTTIVNTNTSITQVVTNPVRYYRAVVQSGTCPLMNSNVVTVTTDPIPNPGVLSATQTICSGQTANLSVTGQTGSIIRWESSTSCSPFTAQTTITNTNATYNTGILPVTTCFRAVISGGVCGNVNTTPVTVTVQGAAQPGSVSPANATVCVGNVGPNLLLTGQSGTIVRWEKSTDNFTTVTTIASTNAIFTGAGAINTPTCFRAVVQSGGCPAASSVPACITPAPNPVAGTLASDQTICEGFNATVTLTGNTANVLRWETSTDNFATLTTISQTTTTFTANNVMGTLGIRAVVSNGFCPPVTSNSVTITTVPVSLGGTLSADAVACEGDNQGDLFLTGYRGNIIRWESSTNNFNSVTTIANTIDTYTWINLTQTTQYRAVVRNGNCPIAYSNSVTITILPAPRGGILSADITVCQNANAGILTLNGFSGTIMYWESSTDNFATVTQIPNNSNTLTYSNLAQTTAYRVVVGSTLCGQVTSTVATVTTVPGTAGGTLMSNTTVCANNNAGTLVLSNYSGNILYWEVSIDNFVTFSTIANTTNSFQYSNVPRDTWFRVFLGGSGGACKDARSTSIKITAVQTADGGTLKSTISGGGCSSNTGVIQLSNYSGRIIRWESSTNNFATITSIANTTALLNYNVMLPTQYRVVLQNSPCPVVYSQVITVNPGMMLDVTPLRECNNKGKIVAVAMGGTPAYSYFITPNSGSQLQAGVFTNVTPGSYTVTARDQNGCVVTKGVTIPTQLTGPFITNVTFNGRNNARVDWIDVAPGGNTVYYQLHYHKTNGTWTTVNVGSNTTYMLMNLDTMGIRTYEVQVRVRCLPSTSYSTWSKVKGFSLRESEGLDGTFESGIHDVVLYPNPNNGLFNLRFSPSERETIIRIYDMTGRAVYQTTFTPAEDQNELSVDLKNQASGIYTVVIGQDNERKTFKLVIE